MPWYGYHPYLNEYIVKNRCKKIMEIGVYNGENAINMIKAASKNSQPEDIHYYGFDFFRRYNIDQITKKLEKTGCNFQLFRGNTLDTLPEAVKMLPKMDIVFIDGGKSFQEATNDWDNSAKLMHKDTGVFIHNSGFYGISRMIEGISSKKYRIEILSPPSEGNVAYIRKIYCNEK
jgi:predicted O-methyltransferase YrrM